MPTLQLFYHHLTNHIVPGPQSISYFVPLLLKPLALLIPRSILARWQSVLIFMPIIVACTVHAWWCMGGVDVISVDGLLWAFFLLVFKDPWRDFRWVGSSTQPGKQSSRQGPGVVKAPTGLPEADGVGGLSEQTVLIQPATPQSEAKLGVKTTPRSKKENEESYPSTLWKRLPWVGTLVISIRLNNWRVNSPSHDRYQPPLPAFKSRTSFVCYALFCFVRGYLVLDLTRAYISYDLYFTDTTVSITSLLPFKSLRYVPPQLVRSMVVGAQAWALISQMFYLPCLLPIGLHALGWLKDEWSPHNWPTYFGSPMVIFKHGIRGFWGRYWHQTMRWSVSGPGYALADALHLRSSGLARYLVITTIAFGLSGTVHMGLVPPEPLHATVNFNTIRLCVAGFFWVQPIAMLFEMLITRLAARTGGPIYRTASVLEPRMLINAIWVVTWFSLCLPLLGEAGRQMGYWRVWPVPVSLWKGIRREGWIAWPVLQSGAS